MAKLAIKDSNEAIIKEEKIIQGAEEKFDPKIAAKYEKTPSKIDRATEPPYGKSPELSVPNVWEDYLSNGIKVFGIENSEVPFSSIQFSNRWRSIIRKNRQIRCMQT